jgi:hypothetical protein
MCLRDNVVAVPATVADDPLVRWRAGFEEVFALIAGRFAPGRVPSPGQDVSAGVALGCGTEELLDDR